MRFFKRIIIFVLLAVTPLLCLAEQRFPASFQAEFILYTNGVKVARMQREYSLSPDGNYHYRSETQPTGLISLFRNDLILEVSHWMLDGDLIKSVRYSYSHTRTKKERQVTIDFDWGKGQVINSINGESWNMPVEPGTLDKLLYQLAIMRDLKLGKSPISYTVADGGKIKTYDFELLGEEILETPLGQLHTLKLSRHKPNSRRETTLWCASKLDYLPVKVENIETDGRKTVAIINSYNGTSH